MITQYPLMDVKQAAEFLNVKRQTLDAWRSRGFGGPKFYRMGLKSIRYTREDLMAFACDGLETGRTSGMKEVRR